MADGQAGQTPGKYVSPVEIRPANVRDVSFVAANMRSEDWREISCQFADGTPRTALAHMACTMGEAWTAHWRGQPIAAFGASPISFNVLSLWAFGTNAMWRAAPAITRHFQQDCAPRWVERGVTRLEARSIEGHESAHRWMLGMGGRPQRCPCWGKNRETFVMFSWSIDDWESARGD